MQAIASLTRKSHPHLVQAAQLLIVLLTLFALISPTPAQSSGTLERLAVASDGTPANKASGHPSVSADGRFVVFESNATNLVLDDTNGDWDIFLRDRQNGTTVRISLSSAGEQADGSSYSPVISADGRFVAFESWAENLVPGGLGGNTHILVRDLQAGTTECASLSSAGVLANFGGYDPAISTDGRFVVFRTHSNNLVPGDDNAAHDIFLRDRLNGITLRASVSSSGEQSNFDAFEPAISGDGRFVAFYSRATNLVPDDTNSSSDVFLRDWQSGTTERISVSSSSVQGTSGSYNPSISANGRFVAFHSYSGNLVPGDYTGSRQIYVRDRQNGTTERVSVSNEGAFGILDSQRASISADGRFVAFRSSAFNLVPDDTNNLDDIFVRDRQAGTTQILSIASDGTPADGTSDNPAISADGRFVAFETYASNLSPGGAPPGGEVLGAGVTFTPGLNIYLPLLCN